MGAGSVPGEMFKEINLKISFILNEIFVKELMLIVELINKLYLKYYK